MKKTTLVVILIALMGLMLSCSEDDDKNDDTNKSEMNYYPMAVGSVWVYSKTEVDSEGKETQSGYEKHAVEKESELNGHSSYDVSSYDGETESEFEEEPSSTNTYYNDNGKIYVSKSFIENIFSVQALGLELPISTELASIKLIDQNETNWDMVDAQSYDNLKFNIMSQEVTFTGTATLKAKYVGEKSYSNTELNINGNAGAFQYIFELTGDIEFTFGTTQQSTLTISSTREYWYMDKIGLVSRIDKKAAITAGNPIVNTLISQMGEFPEVRFNLVSSSSVSAN